MNKIDAFNDTLGTKITNSISTMWCAYIFAAIALVSLPAAIKSGDAVIIVGWVAQTFLQLVLLSIIMVGQRVASKAVEQKIDETHTAALGEFELAKEAREVNNQQIAELRKIAADIHEILKAFESPNKK